ncbi:MAG TPA: TonB-dependent receptor, partial [Oceanicaulis sp.]|nr:TonB-dependent receptor [Oceanicaulis sp.]
DTNNIEQNQSWYQEFRLSGANDRFDWVAGVSYYDENATQVSETGAFTNSIETALFNLGAGTPFSDLENGLLIPFGLQQRLLGHEWTESMYNRGDFSAFAAFADVEWRLTDRFSLIGGARYTRDEKTFSWLNGPRMAPDLDQALAELDALGVLGLAGVSPADFGFDIVFDLSGVAGLACDNGVTVAEGVLCERSDSWDDISPRLVANFNAMDNLLLFASYTQGYKAGGYNSVEVGSRFENE